MIDTVLSWFGLARRRSLAPVKYTGKLSEVEGGPWVRVGGVDAESALTLSAVFAAVSLVSRVVASLPLHVYRTEGRLKEHAISHAAYRLLRTAPNPEMTSAAFRRAMEWQRILYGVGYAQIQWAANYRPLALWPLEKNRVRPERSESGELGYRVDGREWVPACDMLVVPHVTANGIVGKGFIDYAGESLGISLSAQQCAGNLFDQGAKPGGILKHPGTPPLDAREEFKREWQKRHGGAGNAGRTAVLWGGWEYTGEDGSFAPEEAQLLESRRFSTEEVSRWTGIPPHLLYDLSRATFSNIEQQNLDFLVYSLGPALVDYEQEIDRKLLDPPGIYSKHAVSGLLRGDSAARGAFYSQMFNLGVMSINEIRELEDWNPIEGGDTHFVPVNLAPLVPPVPAVSVPTTVVQPSTGEPSTQPAPSLPAPEAPAVPATRTADPAAMRALAVATLDRLGRIEAKAVRGFARKPGAFLTAVDQFYESHRSRLAEAIVPVLAAVGADQSRAVAIASEWVERSRADLLAAAEVPAVKLAESVESAVTGWAVRAGETAARMGGEQ